MSEIEPWRMWGNSQTFTSKMSVVPIIQNTQQLVRIAYGRPETWNFFFAVELLDNNVPGDPGILTVQYDLTIGIGRAQNTIKSFETLEFYWALGDWPLKQGTSKYSASVQPPIRKDLVATSFPDEITDFVAQDIQLKAVVTLTGGPNINNEVTSTVSAYFAPAAHIRPEWFERVGRFRAGENKGF